MLMGLRAFSGVTAEVYSKVFQVVDASDHSGYGNSRLYFTAHGLTLPEPKVDETIDRLRSIGINC
jgi:hypothetical protein